MQCFYSFFKLILSCVWRKQTTETLKDTEIPLGKKAEACALFLDWTIGLTWLSINPFIFAANFKKWFLVGCLVGWLVWFLRSFPGEVLDWQKTEISARELASASYCLPHAEGSPSCSCWLDEYITQRLTCTLTEGQHNFLGILPSPCSFPSNCLPVS